jgi:uncharacterized RDD family membrane protein YckC
LAIYTIYFTPSDNIHYAGFWIRFAAAILDRLILFLIFSLVDILALTTFLYSPSIVEGVSVYRLTVLSLQLLIDLFYSCCFLSSSWMATPGMKAVGIKIVDYNFEQISFGRAIGRFFWEIISAVIVFIGFIMIAFNPKKQGFHDKIANTYVVYSR